MDTGTIRSYARMVVSALPLSCAKRLGFECQEDFLAVIEDMDAYAVDNRSARKLFGLFADYSKLGKELASSRDPDIKKRIRLERESIYHEIVPLLPVPADTPWSTNHGLRSRRLGGYELGIQYNKASSWGRSGSYWHSYVSAPGVPWTDVQKCSNGVVSDLRKELEAWVRDHPIIEERIARAKADF